MYLANANKSLSMNLQSIQKYRNKIRVRRMTSISYYSPNTSYFLSGEVLGFFFELLEMFYLVLRIVVEFLSNV